MVSCEGSEGRNRKGLLKIWLLGGVGVGTSKGEGCMLRKGTPANIPARFHLRKKELNVLKSIKAIEQDTITTSVRPRKRTNLWAVSRGGSREYQSVRGVHSNLCFENGSGKNSFERFVIVLSVAFSGETATQKIGSVPSSSHGGEGKEWQ